MKRILTALAFILATSAFAADVSNPGPCAAFGTTAGTCLQGAGALGSPSSVGTLPAHTLGGTISGGGQQINNVIIGTSTPLAGAFTTLTASTSGSFGTVSGAAWNGLDKFGFNGGASTGIEFIDSNTTGGTTVGFTVNTAAIGAIITSNTGMTIDAIGGKTLTLQSNNANAIVMDTSSNVNITNQAFMAAATSDSGIADSTACLRTSNGQLLKGSGTLGICLGTSGRQFKTAFTPMEAGIDEIARLKLWNYRYIPGYGDSGERMQYGPTAQDVESVIPDLVRKDENNEAINYDIGAFIPITLHALQQLKADNDNLRSCQQSWKCRIFGQSN